MKFHYWRAYLPTALPGATPKAWVIASMGALLGISLTGFVTAALMGTDLRLPFLMIPLAASSVILYVLPTGPLARPWAIVVGHTVSALVGVLVAHAVQQPVLAAGIAVALSIVAMAVTGSLHPPGGSTALLAVLGGPVVQAAGYHYALVPVGLNAVLLVLSGIVYHRWVSGHPYPHVLPDSSRIPEASGFDIRAEDIDAAVVRYGEILDIERQDVEVLVREIERAALQRRLGANDAP